MLPPCISLLNINRWFFTCTGLNWPPTWPYCTSEWYNVTEYERNDIQYFKINFPPTPDKNHIALTSLLSTNTFSQIWNWIMLTLYPQGGWLQHREHKSPLVTDIRWDVGLVGGFVVMSYHAKVCPNVQFSDQTHQMASPDQHSSVSIHGDMPPIVMYASNSHWYTFYLLFFASFDHVYLQL